MILNNNQKNTATCIHLSTFSRFFIPFRNFIGLIFLWVANKDKSEFIDKHGKQVINFQISVLLCAIILGTFAITLFISGILNGIDFIDFNVFNSLVFSVGKPFRLLYIGDDLGAIAINVFFIELALIVLASLKARDGKLFNYPLTINFLK